jgi:hypothetical protein
LEAKSAGAKIFKMTICLLILWLMSTGGGGVGDSNSRLSPYTWPSGMIRKQRARGHAGQSVIALTNGDIEFWHTLRGSRSPVTVDFQPVLENYHGHGGVH